MIKKILSPLAILSFLLTISLSAAPAGAASALGISHGVHGAPNIHLRRGTSSNWSGYAAYNGTFNSVSASWTQPSVSCTSQNTYSSYWVGLDGYNSSTVEQLGTEGDCSNGSPSYYVWYEMYPKFGYYINIPVKAGDNFSASVTYSGRNSFTLSITNNTQHKSFSTSQKSPQARRASAEAIVEAPYSGGTLPLANFGKAYFTNTRANGNPVGNYTYDAITMNNPYGMKSTPSGLTNGTDFNMTWSSN
jgi:hypothetical protein